MRSRTYVVEEVASGDVSELTKVRLACVDDDAQGQRSTAVLLSDYFSYEPRCMAQDDTRDLESELVPEDCRRLGRAALRGGYGKLSRSAVLAEVGDTGLETVTSSESCMPTKLLQLRKL